MWKADDFPTDPYGHVTNQAGHAMMVGVPLALLGLLAFPPLAVPVFVALAYWVVWELIIQRGNLWADSLMDTACVMAGASVICGGFYYITDFWPAWITATVCFLAYALVVGIGALRRWQP